MMITKSKLVITVLAILLVTVLVFMSIATMAQTITQVILNLLNGQQYFGTPHVYQGNAVNWQPTYYGPSIASGYWEEAIISSSQPVLQLIPDQAGLGEVMLWSETYSGGPVKISIVGTYTSGSVPVGGGYEIYLFLKPTTWSVSPQYNNSIPYGFASTASPIMNAVIFPQSSTPYLVIEWNPWWHYGWIQSGVSGQWDVWVVRNPSGTNPSVGPRPSPNLGSPYAGWDGIGEGEFNPNPGDRINITVVYNPSTNTLSGVAIDLNTGAEATFILNLNGYYTPPSSGNYVFGVGASTGYGDANWALLYVAVAQQLPPSSAPTVTVQPLASIMYLITHPWVIIAIILIIVIIIALIAASISRRHRRRYRYYYRY